MTGTSLRILSYNIQAGIAVARYRQYLTRSWRHVLPHPRALDNLDAVARLVRGFDIVGLQEVDAGSLRSGFVDQARYIARRAGVPWWYRHTTRRVGQVSRHANALLSRWRPVAVEEHRLPGMIPGRGAVCARFGAAGAALAVYVVHLSLGRRARLRQLDYLAERVADERCAVVLGDFNCTADSPELERFLARTGLCVPASGLRTFPAWAPSRAIDHVLVPAAARVRGARVLPLQLSDHRPLAVEVDLPVVLPEAA